MTTAQLEKPMGWGGRRAGAGGKPKSVEDHLRDGTFIPSRHGALLDPAELAPAILDRIGLAPRRRLLLGENVKERTDGPWLTEFCREFCRQTIGRFNGAPLELEPFQQVFVDDALAFNDLGERLYTTALLGVPRKCGKTTMCSGAALALASPAEGEGKPLVVLAAGSREQADPLFAQAMDFVHGDPSLEATFLALKMAISCPANGGSIKRVAGDGKLNHGLNPYNVFADELHAWVTPKQVENWAALTTADGAREDAIFWVITTAGWDMNSILGRLYKTAWASPLREMRPEMGGGGFVVRDPESRLLVHWYSVKTGTTLEDVDEFKRANPASWRTSERIGRDLAKATIDEQTKLRLYGNAWTSARERWIASDRWAALADAGIEIPEGAEVVLAIDAAHKYDTTAVTWAHRLEDGRVAIRSRVWSARQDVAHHVFVPGGRIDNELVETFIVEELASRYSISEVVYDPRYFDTQAAHLSDAGLVVAEFPQNSTLMADAYQHFYEAAGAGEIVHDGDPVLRQHVEAAAATLTERGWKVWKLKSSQPTDALTASVMARERAARAETNVYEAHDLLIL